MQHFTKAHKVISAVLTVLLVFSLLAGTAGCSIPLKSDAESSQSTKPDQAKETKQETEVGSQAATEPEGEAEFALSVDEPYISAEDGVLFTARAGVGKETITLLRDGKAVGSLKDDGTDGDETAGDGVYSLFVQDPVPEGQEAVYAIGQGSLVSESVTVYLFGPLTEEERAKAEETQLKIREKLEALSRCDWTEEERQEMEQFLTGLKQDGRVRVFSVGEDSLYIKLSSGLAVVYTPASEYTDAAGPDVQVSVITCQPFYTDMGQISYPKTMANYLDALLPNYSRGLSYDDTACDRNMIKELGQNQIVLWHGHGYYHEKKGPCLQLGEDFSWDKYTWDLGYFDDCVHDRIMNGILLEFDSGKVCISSQYIDKYCGSLDGSFLYLAACSSGQSNQLAQAFLNKGATAVVGNTRTILRGYNVKVQAETIGKMMEVNQYTHDFYTLREALTYAKQIHGTSDADPRYDYYDEDGILQQGEGAEALIFGGTAANEFRLSKAGAVKGTVSDVDDPELKVADAAFTFRFTMPDGEEIDYEISPKPVSDASGSYVVWLPPTRLTMAVSAEEYEAYTEEITVEYGKEQKKDIELEKKLRSIYGAVVGTSHSDDMWYATVYVLDKADHLILTDTGSFAAFVFHDDFSGGVYATVDFGSVTIWKANDRSIIVKLYYSYGDRTIVSVYSLDEKNHLVQDPDIQVEDPDQHYYEQLFYSRLEYHQLLTREEVQKKYYVPKETVKTDRAIDDLLKDINHVFPDPELKSTSLKKDENDAVIAYTESYTKNGITLQIEALTDGTIVSVRIDDSKQYSTRDYTYKATDASFTAGSEMRALYDAVIRSEALSMKGNRDQLAAFDFDRYQVSERVSNGTHLGFELGGSLTNGNVTVTYRKSTHEIASTSFTSFVEIQIGE